MATRMIRRRQRVVTGLALSVVTVAAVSVLLALVNPWIPAFNFRTLYVLPVLLVAVVAGTWPAVATAVLSALTFQYFFIPPPFSFQADNPRLYISMAVFLGTAIIAGQLTARLQHAVRELAESRARLVAAADEERRRIERDLHDGAQQRLVSLELELRTVHDDAPPPLRGQLEHLADELTDTQRELRDFAHGIHPPLLAERGLPAALGSLIRRCAVPVELSTRVDRRLPPEVELAAYFVVSEAVANAVKHADASLIRISAVAVDRGLQVTVRDDGRGGASFTAGSGLLGLRDRVEALGGQLRVASGTRGGTTVRAELPLHRLGRTGLGVGLSHGEDSRRTV